MSTATVIKVEVADYLGWGRNTEGAGGDWSADQIAKLGACLNSGARQFYWPPPLDNRGEGHRWSFLRPVKTLDTVAGTGDYTLPSNYGGLIGDMWCAAGDNVINPIRVVGYGKILQERAKNPVNCIPAMVAVVPEDADGTAAQTWSAAFGPGAPNDAYTVSYQMHISPQDIDGDYNLGGDFHFETLLASCLAVAEQRYQERDQSGRMRTLWLDRLAASIAYDRRNAPEHLGQMVEGPEEILRRRSNYCTYNGTRYPS